MGAGEYAICDFIVTAPTLGVKGLDGVLASHASASALRSICRSHTSPFHSEIRSRRLSFEFGIGSGVASRDHGVGSHTVQFGRRLRGVSAIRAKPLGAILLDRKSV